MIRAAPVWNQGSETLLWGEHQGKPSRHPVKNNSQSGSKLTEDGSITNKKHGNDHCRKPRLTWWDFKFLRVKTLVAGRRNLLVCGVLCWSSCFTPRPVRAKLWNLPLSVSVCGLSHFLNRFRFWKSYSMFQDVGVFTPVLLVTKSCELHVGARCKHVGREILNSRVTVYWLYIGINTK